MQPQSPLSREEAALLAETVAGGGLVVRPVTAAGRSRSEGRRYALAERLVDLGLLARTVDVGERPFEDTLWSAYVPTPKGGELVAGARREPASEGGSRRPAGKGS